MKNVVLTFHNVTDSTWFEKTIRILSKFYSFGSLDNLYERLNKNNQCKMPTEMCYITFDDGERTVYENVYPIIKKYNIPIALFVSPYIVKNGGSFWFQRLRQIDDSKVELMKVHSLAEINRQIDKMDADGQTNVDSNINLKMFNEMLNSGLVSFGAHTQHHPILRNENDEISKREIEQSIIELKQLTHKNVDYFAYPNGSKNDYSLREIDFLRRSGIKMAFTTNYGSADNKDMYQINRIGITNGNTLHILLKVMCPHLFFFIKRLIK